MIETCQLLADVKGHRSTTTRSTFPLLMRTSVDCPIQFRPPESQLFQYWSDSLSFCGWSPLSQLFQYWSDSLSLNVGFCVTCQLPSRRGGALLWNFYWTLRWVFYLRFSCNQHFQGPDTIGTPSSLIPVPGAKYSSVCIEPCSMSKLFLFAIAATKLGNLSISVLLYKLFSIVFLLFFHRPDLF